MITAFRNAVNALTDNGSSYFPVITEGQGFLNILSGVSQIGVGHAMKRSSQEYYYRTQSQRHIDRGHNALKLGAVQFLPGTLVAGSVAVAALLASNYFQNKN